MCRDYNELVFTHFVVDNNDGTIFGSARVNGSGSIANFLILKDGGIKQQSQGNWGELTWEYAQIVRQRFNAAYGLAPIYHTEGLLY